ncbi:MAG: hypothetical protein WCD38_11665 [Candidatus Tumulicola sp.]
MAGRIDSVIRHGCGGKFAFEDITHARKHLYHVLKESKSKETARNNKGLNVYRCAQCNQWHVGHSGSLPRYGYVVTGT